MILALALATPLAWADPLDALEPVARQFYARAEAEEDRGRFDSAENFYRLVVQHDPRFVPALLGLGRALEAQGETAAAEQVYRDGPGDPDVLVALATLVEPTRPAEALSLWRQAQAARLGDPLPYLHESRLLLGASDPPDLDGALAAWRTYETLLVEAEPDGAALLAIADALIATETRAPEGVAMLADFVERFPSSLAAAGARERLDRAQLEAEALLVEIGRDEPLPGALVPVASGIDAALAAGRVDEALLSARQLVAEAPGSSAAHGRYADALAALGRWTDAEIEARVARGLAPDDAITRARLGRLLHEAYGGRRDVEAL
ncbi:MAG: tetratricopeptide repeat protein, partial [Deltaproteobacteria bacterium]|nr:tetratricopeptide repeat protein [Deltaproteobacteria bacterium]